MTRSRSFGLALVAPLLLAWASFAGSAAAAPPREAGLGGVLTGEAHQQWVEGKRMYQDASDDKGYERALAKFRRAYELVPDSRLLFNIAACEKQLKHYGDTVRDLRKYMQLTPSLTTKERDQATDLLKTLEPYVSELTVNANVEGATVTLDADTVGTTPISGTVLIEAGKRHLHATKAGMVPFEQDLDVPGGGPSSVSIMLRPDTPPAHLEITTDGHADITLDGQPVGADGVFRGMVKSGPHSIHVEEKGKVPKDEQLSILDGEQRSVTMTLDDDHHGVPVWAWFVGGAVVAGGLATAGYFIFRPGDVKDPGPVGNLSPGAVTPSSRLGVIHFQ